MDARSARQPPKDIAVSIKYVVDHGATVILVAGGGDTDESLETAVEYAYKRDVPVVGAAGSPPREPTIVAPALYDEALAISGLDRNGNFADKASVSAYGIDFAAPAVDLMLPLSRFTPPPPIAADDGLNFGAKLAITIAAVAAFLLAVGGLIGLAVRGILRRRRQA